MTRLACAHIHMALGYLLLRDWNRARVELQDAMTNWTVGDPGRLGLSKIMNRYENREITMQVLAGELASIVDGKAGLYG